MSLAGVRGQLRPVPGTRHQRTTAHASSSPLSLSARTNNDRDTDGRISIFLGRFGAAATFKTAFAKVQIDVVFCYVSQAGIGICWGDRAG
jgi:hypothetical protein